MARQRKDHKEQNADPAKKQNKKAPGKQDKKVTKPTDRAMPHAKSTVVQNDSKLANNKPKKKIFTLSNFNENTTYPENGKYIHYDVCVLMKDHFEHKEFESKSLAEKCAIKISETPWSVSIHECTFESKNGHRKEIKSELIAMYSSGEKYD